MPTTLILLCLSVPPCEDHTDTGEAEMQELTSAISQLTLSNISNMALFYLESKGMFPGGFLTVGSMNVNVVPRNMFWVRR